MRLYRINVLLYFSQLALRGEGPACQSELLHSVVGSSGPGGKQSGRRGGERREVLNAMRLWAFYYSSPEDMCIDLRERETSISCRPYTPQSGFEPVTSVCALIRHQTHSLFGVQPLAGAEHIILTTILIRLLVSANQNQILERSLATILSNGIQHFR